MSNEILMTAVAQKRHQQQQNKNKNNEKHSGKRASDKTCMICTMRLRVRIS
jgi:hypothetical protein